MEPVYSKPIQYLNDLFENEETNKLVRDNVFLLEKLVKVYQKNDIEALRDFKGFVNFNLRLHDSESVKAFYDVLMKVARMMIEEIQASVYKDKTNGLRLVK